MRINELSLSGFRNYRRQSLTFDPDCNVIYGENAQGKTNLLEAVVYLSCGKSPRTHADRELIGFDETGAVLEGRILSRDREFVTHIELNRGKKRRMTVNGVTAKNAAALSDVLHTVFFAPEDLFLIRAGAAERRRFMDVSLCQLRPRYGEALRQYERLYDHKTRILRDSEDKPELLDLLPEFNEGLCRYGAAIVSYRARFCAALAEHPNIAGVKEASGNMSQVVELFARCGDKLDIYSGEDALTVANLAMGGKGTISVLSNVLPKQAAAMTDAFFAGRVDEAAQMQCRFLPLIKDLFCEANPIPVKAAISAMGFGQEHIRLPLVPMQEENRQRMLEHMRQLGVNV